MSDAAIAPGSRLGVYEVQEKIGQGGMGVVWRARDTRLGRDAALKVLPEEFTRDVGRLARFEREARLLASLNHPNIAQIYGLEMSGSTRALAMELAEGPTLAERIARGAIPVDQCLAIARQIAEALEDAHDKGIVHRDLKPQNIKVAADGKVKVLDFGLAKAMDHDDSASPAPLLTQSPTLSGTLHGTILGTAAYMAPEQAAGLAVDRRADIWAFGVVLYEMLAGKSLFDGETVTHVLASVMKDEPDLAVLPAATPPAIRDLIRRCLKKKPRERLQAIGDARLALEEAADPRRAGADASAAAGPQRVPARRSALAAVVPWTLLVVVALGSFALLRSRGQAVPGAPPPPLRFTVLPAEAGDIDGFPAIAPDGRSVIYGLAAPSGITRLCVHSLETGETRILLGTEYAEDGFWSPDGRWIGFFAKGWLHKMEIATGLSQKLAPASDPRGGGWSERNEIFFTPNSGTGLYKIPAAGGTPVQVLGLDPYRKEGSHRYPVPLPGGRGLVLTSIDSEGGGRISWLPLDGGKPRVLLPDMSRTAYDPRGYLLWIHEGSLVGQPFDAGRGELSGNPFPIAEHAGVDPQKSGRGYFGASRGMVAMRVGLDWLSQLEWYDRRGRALGDVSSAGQFDEVELAPDGRRAAVSVSNAGSVRDAWVYDTAAKDRATRLTFEGASNPTWDSEGRRVCYSRVHPGGWLVACRPADGGGEEETNGLVTFATSPDSISPKEPLMVMEAITEKGGVDLWLLRLEGDRTPRPFLSSAAAEAHGVFSPDGRLLAYASDEDGLPQIYVQEIAGARSRWQVTTNGADEPAWRADGKELYYVGLDRTLYAVPVTNLSPFTVGAPVKLFAINMPLLALSGNRSNYAPSPDGQRFLVNGHIGPESEPGLRVIMNWSPPATEQATGH